MSNRSPHAFEASTTDRGLEGGTSKCAVVCTHELHERTAHAQDDEHDGDVLVIEERVPLIDHQVGAAQDALAKRLGVERPDLAGAAGGHAW